MQHLLALITLAGFIALASYSYGRCCSPNPQYKLVWKDAHSADLADVYGLTPDNVDEPIGIWEKKK